MKRLVWMSAVMLALASHASAEDAEKQVYAEQQVDTSFEVTRDRLEAMGYSELRMVNNNAYYLDGYDREGSEVLLRIDGTTGELVSSTYPGMDGRVIEAPATVNPHL